MQFFTVHGGRSNEGRVQIDGMNVGSAFNGGGVSSFAYDTANVDEIQIAVSGGLGEADIGGPALNIIPRTGGNNFSGTAFFSNAGEWSQGSNLDDRLRAAGITENPGADQVVGHQLLDRRADPARSAVVLRHGPHVRQPHRQRRPVRQPQRRRRVQVDLGQGSEHQVAQRQRQEGRRRPPDRPDHAAQQARLLLRLSAQLRRLDADGRRRRMPQARGRLGRARQLLRHHLAGVGHDVGRPRDDRPGAPGRRRSPTACCSRPAYSTFISRLGRPGSGRRADQLHPGHRAERRSTAAPTGPTAGSTAASATTSRRTCGGGRRRTSPARTR